ncbi:hypothetical protein K474DRAFT_128811 [Panus rudis PR-1116 ss-1]|nr:hypothetical protein K474DRAFT_128811 [Panus rudis PR-1116 ss-1]
MEVDYSSESDDENTPVARIDYQPVPPHCVPTPVGYFPAYANTLVNGLPVSHFLPPALPKVPPVPPAPKMSRTMTRQPSLSATTRMVPVYNPASHEPQMYIPTPASPTSPEMYRERERNAAVTLSSMSARGSISSMRSTSPGPSPVRARQESVPMPSPTTSRFPTARTGVPPPSMNPNISMDSGRHLTTRSFEGDESMAGLKVCRVDINTLA